ncbi:MAG: methyltransferase domain-containing protein [Candidatus Magasanikbacteria bacterium]|nr:methyltransferase domain-containing protein [Candidatus Magasanikbacteria bacterium]
MSIKNFYNKKVYKKINRFRRKAILSFIKKNNPVVLDVGCGRGLLGEIIKKEKKATVFGIDISEDATKEASKKLDNVFCFNLETNQEWPDELKMQEYDYVVISEVLEHLMEPEEILFKIKQAISHNTEIIITVPNILWWKNRLKIFLGHFEYTDSGLMDKGHIHFFSWKSFKDLIRKTGYHITQENHHIPTRGTKYFGRIWPGLFAKQFIVKIKKNNIVIYTAILGGKDALTEPKFIPDNCDFICFTDDEVLKSKTWKVVNIGVGSGDPARDSREMKLLPHKYLSDYEYSIWVDGNMLVHGDVNELIDKYLKSNNIAMFDHNQLTGDKRNCIYKEAEVLVKMAKTEKYKDDPSLILKQVSRYKEEGYPEDNGLISGMVILRKHNYYDVKKVMEDWWSELKNNSKRDQLSFNYVAWKNNLDFVYIQGDSRDNKYFKRLPHLRKKNYKI